MVENHPGDSINNVGSKPIVARSNFPYSYNLAGSYRFGELGVCDVQDTVPDEDVPLHSGHNIRSMNLKAPLMGSIKMHKEFFDVPLTVLLPFNYDKVFTQPQNGDDVDASLAGLNVQGFDFLLKNVFLSWLRYGIESFLTFDGTNIVIEDAAALSSLIKWFISAERFYSKGNLLHSLGIQLGKTFSYDDSDAKTSEFGKSVSFDRFFDKFYSKLWSYLSVNSVDSASGTRLFIDNAFVNCGEGGLDAWQVLEKMRDASDISVIGQLGSVAGFILDSFAAVDEEDLCSFVLPSITCANSKADAKPISLARPMAYQVSCAEFFTNSHVDYMYSAQLWRQFLRSLYDDYGINHDTFTLNSINYEYDYCSAYYVDFFLSAFEDQLAQGVISYDSTFLDWSRHIFGYNRSLRYVDYFTGARPRPLAVGDVTVSAAGGYVNIVDTIIKRWYAKFLNQVNRGKRKLSDYMRKLFPGLTMSRDFHDPMWLAHVEDVIYSPEVEGTDASQNVKTANTTTSVLKSNGERYAFEYHTQYYGVCIGLIYFDIKRYYTDVIERPNFYVDRNDYFNPYLQFVGDQVVYRDELYSPASHGDIFGYQGRNMELKERVDYCFGAFSEDDGLDDWLFVAKSPVPSLGESWHISPDYIRSKPSELNKFFSSLTDFSLAKYYHFIIVNSNVSDKDSPMIVNPQLD